MRIFVFLVFALSFAAPAAAQSTAGISPDYEQQDADIAVRMREILAELGNYGDVTVQVNDGVITLRGTTTSATEITALDTLAGGITGVVAVKNQVTETADIGRRLDPAIERFRARIDQFIVFFPLALIAGLVFSFVVFVGFSIARMRQPWERLAPNLFIAELFRQLLRIAFVIFGIVIALDIVNATALLSTILGAAGIIGLALGFAVRDTVENFIASIMLSIRQPFRPNDTVEINGDQGKVIRLTSRATILLSFDGNHIRIPNATVFKSRIINFSQNAERRFKFAIMVERDADLKATRGLIADTVQALPFTLDEPAADTWIEALHPEGVELVVTGWVNQNESSLVRAKGEALRQVKLALQGAGIVIPDATQAIQMIKEPTKPASAESTGVETVAAKGDAALTRIVDAERGLESSEDLLREDSLKE
ncbi:mechanosensitive ion channel protein MscS [Loktanella sp. D2R18]|uniref:mechanosensitive ion channel domain-containing protein n=1 Tax=Rhodobacterales TaxID=204455 RepID=UPI000DE99A2F|nr:MULTISPECIES: mechanosensitive ion channel domain-containing protein [Rhodobacterales]MDO6588641.1 mechanosensitive ion channel [Yoonia sp. 1_MG-2023]RBW42109.1 mechanosensitive ion channel protein MscS [Loktanella sp. D2R18]